MSKEILNRLHVKNSFILSDQQVGTKVTVSDSDGSTNAIPILQVNGANKQASSALLASFNTTNTSAVAPALNFLKSGNATVGSNTVVANGEILGEVNFFGADGTDFESAGARIHAAVDGTPGTGDMPAKIVLSTTPDGSETLAARLTVSAEGLVTIAAATTPASTTGATGTAVGAILTATGGAGGVSTNASGTGGVGGGYSLTGGVGGACSGATAPTGGAGGALTAVLGAGAACSVAASGNSIGGAGGAASVTTGDGGAVSGAVAGTATGGASGAISLLTGTGGAVTATTGTNVGGASGIVTLGSGVGGAASGATDTGGASGAVTIKTGTGGAGDTGGASGVLTLQTGAAGAGGSPVVGHISFEPGAAEKWRMTSVGVLTSVAGTPANAATADGSVLATGGFAITDVANAWIDDASQGSGTVTHYIGNQTITTASDKRLKTNIHDTARDSDAILKALRVVDFDWNDPTDRHNPHGKHSRGTYMGMIAQEMIEAAPWAVNAPGDSKNCSACRAGQECREHSEQYWFAEYQYIVPPLVKAYQSMSARFEAAISRIEALEAKLAQ